MSRILPHPLLSGAMFSLWLLLNQSLSPGHVLLAAAIALIAGWIFAGFDPSKARVRRPVAIIRLMSRVVFDVAKSNAAVALIILGAGRRNRRPGFVRIPLELRNPYGLATLACIITSTPGPLWVDLDHGSGTLTIHVLDLADEGEWVRTIKGRYEEPLLEIFA